MTWCRLTEARPSNAALTTRTRKCVSPSGRAPTCPACLSESSSISSTLALSTASFSCIILIVGPPVAGGAAVSASPSALSSAAPSPSATTAAASCFIFASMLRNPLFLPGVKATLNPDSLINSGLTRSMSAALLPLNPFTRIATSPLVSCASESPSKNTLPSCAVACTWTTDRQPGTLFSAVLSRSSMGARACAMKRSCWYRSLASGTVLS
mmetsp:Transcript_10765/g.25981  ORF Transcript_10765/g.25981 Transcript_10765/m.25981 type:complete len:211 (+) Transcript_10765:425-1057(+)